MTAVVADTHAIVWYLSAPDRLSEPARDAMHDAARTGCRIYVSPITTIELVYLVEKGRLENGDLEQLLEALRDPASVIRLAPMDLALTEALRTVPRAVVSDMPDRIIAATAKRLDVPLISRDAKIRLSDVDTIW